MTLVSKSFKMFLDSNLGDQSDFPWSVTEVLLLQTSVITFLMIPATSGTENFLAKIDRLHIYRLQEESALTIFVLWTLKLKKHLTRY